jgi:2-hydroxychromene-2-carboxylate isomerase
MSIDTEVLQAGHTIRNLSIEAFAERHIITLLSKKHVSAPNPRIIRVMINILKFLMQNHKDNYFSEAILRNLFGNNPDVSKGLRYLVQTGIIIRKRNKPYLYCIKYKCSK